MHPLLHDVALVVFDLDGTLVDSVPDLTVAVDAALADVGLRQRGEARVRGWVGNGSYKLIERALRDALGQAPEAERLTAVHDRFLHHYGVAPNALTRLYPGARIALDGLREKGLTLALVTNKPQAFIAPVLEGVGLSGYFALCLGGDALPYRKPDPTPLLHVARHFSVAPECCLMVGDSRHDVEAGKRAGFRTVAVPYGYNHGEPVATSHPDALVESLAELV